MEHLDSYQPINLYDIDPVREKFTNVPSQPGLSNFLLGAAYCGNGSLYLAEGLADSRNHLLRVQSGRIIVDALQQLISITTKAEKDPTFTDQERFSLLYVAVSLISVSEDESTQTLSRWPSFGVPEEVKRTVERWGKELWKEEWEKAADTMSNSWYISHLVTADSNYMGTDFVGHCIQTIIRESGTLSKDLFIPWNDISYLRIFWEQHRKPTRLELLTRQIPKSPYVKHSQ